MINHWAQKNLLFHWSKNLFVLLIISLLLTLSGVGLSFVSKIRSLASQPLKQLNTTIILQKDQQDKDAQDIVTQGVIEPFNLTHFNTDQVSQVASLLNVDYQLATSLLLWQFNPQDNKVIIGLHVDDPSVGPRQVEQWLTPKSRFFFSDQANEVILEKHFAKLFGYKLNDQYQLASRTYQVVGLVDFPESSNLVNAQVFMPYDTARSLVGLDANQINQAYLSIADASKLKSVKLQLAQLLPGFTIATSDRLVKNLSTFNRLIYQFGTYIVLAVIGATILSVMLIIFIWQKETHQFYQTLTLIGWPKRTLLWWSLIELSYLLSLAIILSGLVMLFAQKTDIINQALVNQLGNIQTDLAGV